MSYNFSGTLHEFTGDVKVSDQMGIGTDPHATNPLHFANLGKISWVNNAGTGTINGLWVNANDEVEFGAAVRLGPINLGTNWGSLDLVDGTVSGAAEDDVASYSFQVDDLDILQIYSQANAAGSGPKFDPANGIWPQARAISESALTNQVARPFQVRHITSGTPAASIGVGLEFVQETSASNYEKVGALDFVMSSVASGSEAANLNMYAISGGALSLRWSFYDDGSIVFTNPSAGLYILGPAGGTFGLRAGLASATALQLQDESGNAALTVDTTNDKLVADWSMEIGTIEAETNAGQVTIMDMPISGGTENTPMGWKFAIGTSVLFELYSEVDATGNAVDTKSVQLGAGVNLGIDNADGDLAWGTGAAGVIALAEGTGPSSYPADVAQMWVENVAAGNAAFHFAAEQATDSTFHIKLYQQAYVADASTAHNVTDFPTTNTALDNLGTKINSIFSILKNTGFMASS